MYAENNGVKVWYEMQGRGEPTLVMVHGFQIAHSEYLKRAYVPFLSRHMRVVTLDLRGNGRSDRPEAGYDLETYVEDVHAVVEAAGLDSFAMAGHSLACRILIQYQTTHPGTATHLVLLSGSVNRSPENSTAAAKEALGGLIENSEKNPEIALQRFIDLAISRNYSLRNKELCWSWAHETSPRIWKSCAEAIARMDVDEHLKHVDIPTLIVHGENDRLLPLRAPEHIHRNIDSSRFMVISEADHGFNRTWPQVARHMLEFLKPETRHRTPRQHYGEAGKVLWISSPVGLGHVRRDLAIANDMRSLEPDLSIDWLAVDPVRSFLEAAGERVHPLSDALWDECREFESHAEGYALDAAEAGWEMDKLFNHNFMVFTDAVRDEGYDLVVGDESWEVAQYLHYNPSLKTAPFVFMTDFVGASNVSEDPTRQAHVHDFNGSWVEMRELHPEASDLSLFIGQIDDIPDTSFGEGLPNRKEWAAVHFQFPGYVLPFDPTCYSDREALRTELGYAPEEQILLVAVGGTAAGRPLIEKCLEAQAILRRTGPEIRTIVLCGPRIAPGCFGPIQGVEFRSLTPDPIQLYAACDVAVVQGGLSTTMELTALGRPFLYFPLKDHFEQQQFVPFRLERYEAGVRMDFGRTGPSQLAEAIAANIGTPVNYRPVSTEGAKRAASMIVELLNGPERVDPSTNVGRSR